MGHCNVICTFCSKLVIKGDIWCHIGFRGIVCRQSFSNAYWQFQPIFLSLLFQCKPWQMKAQRSVPIGKCEYSGKLRDSVDKCTLGLFPSHSFFLSHSLVSMTFQRLISLLMRFTVAGILLCVRCAKSQCPVQILSSTRSRSICRYSAKHGEGGRWLG